MSSVLTIIQPGLLDYYVNINNWNRVQRKYKKLELMCFTKHEYQPTSTLTMLCKITTPSGLKVAYDEQMGENIKFGL